MAEFTGGAIEPTARFVAVTPNDSADLTLIGDYTHTTGLYIGGAGDLEVRNEAGNDIVIQNIPAGSLLPISTNRVLAGSTTATNIVALF